MSRLYEMEAISEGLWVNARDSIIHALDHFFERGQTRTNRSHHDKWIVLSVNHAAECICNMRLIALEPGNRLLNRTPRWFPSLSQTLSELRSPQLDAGLSPAERQLLVLMGKVSEIRHQLMHRIADDAMDVSVAAMCMVGMLKYIERFRGETAADMVPWQSWPVESDVVAAIRYTKHQEYNDFVALFLGEKYGSQWLPTCPACGVRAVTSTVCEACYTELGSVECNECGDRAYYVELAYAKDGTARVECECGAAQHI
ncbi:hypothetical protein ML401_04620 [Bradyrhizobium sp. 62B]|uniref:hypothetical protein n=1 Tax=Bradyrhizobium sp. 62B TaxID=2898442 RepID=UPI002558345D|nr:hypothetical protein ML401_04620 [Bradyrhizobium sp. 62B]